MGSGSCPPSCAPSLRLTFQWPRRPRACPCHPAAASPVGPPQRSSPAPRGRGQPCAGQRHTQLAECRLVGGAGTSLLGKGLMISALGNFWAPPASFPSLSASELQRPISRGFNHQGSLLLSAPRCSAPVPTAAHGWVTHTTTLPGLTLTSPSSKVMARPLFHRRPS